MRDTLGALGILVAAAATQACSKSAPACVPLGVDGGRVGAFDAANTVPFGPASVLEESKDDSRDGAYVDSQLTRAYASTLHVDTTFHATYDGVAYAEPLYVDGLRPGVDAIVVASWTNHVTALDASTGAILWDTILGQVVNPSSLACDQPTTQYYGIISTPIIDAATRTLYVESFQEGCGNHFVFALSMDDGSVRPGWPAAVGASVQGFVPGLQHARAGLALMGGSVYVAFSGILFDCPGYNGWVVGISTTDPTQITSWSTTATQGGIWGGIAVTGDTLFFSTGNSTAGQTTWGGQQAVFALPGTLEFDGSTKHYFTPSNWPSLDSRDLDLGSSTVVLFDLPGSTPTSLVAALGKGGVLHLLDQKNLGGHGTGNGNDGEGLFSAQVSIDNDGVKGRLTSYVTPKGRYVVGRTTGWGYGCPETGHYDLIASRLLPGSPPRFTVAWCAESNGMGSPISTTTDGTSNAIVWSFAAQGNQHLYGFDGDTGKVVYDGGGSGDIANGAWRFSAPIVAKGRVFVAGDGQVYAWKGGP
jgi:outer membrane protein assembly factor BamB